MVSISILAVGIGATAIVSTVVPSGLFVLSLTSSLTGCVEAAMLADIFPLADVVPNANHTTDRLDGNHQTRFGQVNAAGFRGCFVLLHFGSRSE